MDVLSEIPIKRCLTDIVLCENVAYVIDGNEIVPYIVKHRLKYGRELGRFGGVILCLFKNSKDLKKQCGLLQAGSAVFAKMIQRAKAPF